jgi:hypothetical protein
MQYVQYLFTTAGGIQYVPILGVGIQDLCVSTLGGTQYVFVLKVDTVCICTLGEIQMYLYI